MTNFSNVDAELAAWQSNVSSSSSSGAFSWGGSANGDSPPHASSSTSGSTRIPTSGRKLKFRSGTPSPPLIGSAPASFSGSVTKYHHPSAAATAAAAGTDDGIASDESISESDELLSTTSQVWGGEGVFAVLSERLDQCGTLNNLARPDPAPSSQINNNVFCSLPQGIFFFLLYFPAQEKV